MLKTKFTRKRRKHGYALRITVECKWTRLVEKQVRNEFAIFRNAIQYFDATRDYRIVLRNEGFRDKRKRNFVFVSSDVWFNVATAMFY
jgi:hypothetical protein